MPGKSLVIGPSPHHLSPIGRAQIQSCKNEYLVVALVEETAVQAVVGSIVWGFRTFKKPRGREINACSYALHSVLPFTFFRESERPREYNYQCGFRWLRFYNTINILHDEQESQTQNRSADRDATVRKLPYTLDGGLPAKKTSR